MLQFVKDVAALSALGTFAVALVLWLSVLFSA